jgi:hypothetical protein
MPVGCENIRAIEERGWCIFEKLVSSISKIGCSCLSLRQLPPSEEVESFDSLCNQCTMSREPPMRPDEFEQMLRKGVDDETQEKGKGIVFTSNKDLTEVIIPQFRLAFLRLMGQAQKLIYTKLGWGDEELEKMISTLVYANSHCSGLDPWPTRRADANIDGLYLQLNNFTEAGIMRLGGALAERNVLPNLTKLWITLPSECEDEAVRKAFEARGDLVLTFFR